ncbi:hypothetical protein Dsin_009119 [Dipteronia sinensis]|uniref:GH16 domain-containing protein n=1 Tax=Dipteronia sinensis TaxID=43782 RepID=A0AAE0AR61_9ROSI|nr:hypothetical protein Dsin_009119 [Dipteronia sinensis]
MKATLTCLEMITLLFTEMANLSIYLLMKELVSVFFLFLFGFFFSFLDVFVWVSERLLLLLLLLLLSVCMFTGSGFVSHDLYLHGFFSASIKLPADYTAGVVVAFYMSNGDIFKKNHDEIDFEFLGNIRGKDWRIQTNVYGNGSTNIGREERYNLWFDPSDDFHQYSILWTDSQIIFFVDSVPIREFKRTASMGGDFPSKPMSLYATIWDGSDWATGGGKYRVNYKYAPYVTEFSDFILHGCAVDPIEQSSSRCDTTTQGSEESIPTGVSPMQRIKMDNFRTKHMTYSLLL